MSDYRKRSTKRKKRKEATLVGDLFKILFAVSMLIIAILVGVTQPISKWSYQIRRPEDVAWAVSRAFFIARSGRPEPGSNSCV